MTRPFGRAHAHAHALVALMALIAIVALMVLGAGAAHANGAFETYGPDPRMRALGNAGDAVDDVAAAHTNPAALGRASGNLAFEAAFSLDTPVLECALANGAPEDKSLLPATAAPVAGYQFAFTIPIDLVLEKRLFVGAVAYFPTQVLVRARAYDPQRPFFYAYDSYTDHYDLSVGAGARITDWLFVGAGLRLAAGQSGDIKLAVDPVRGRLTTQSADTFQYPTAALMAGLLVGPLGVDDVFKVSAGVVYRDKSSFDVHLPAALTIGGADVDAVLDVLVIANFEPRTVSTGLSFDIVKDVTVAVDGAYVFWHEAPPPLLESTVKIGGDGVDALGLDGALDAPSQDQNRVVSPAFRDTMTLRTGVEWRTLKNVLALRAGYQYRPTPVPDQTSGTNIIDNNAHVITAGLGVTFKVPAVFARPVTVDAGYQAHILEPRTAKKTNPADDVGDWTASGAVHALAIGFTYRFE